VVLLNDLAALSPWRPKALSPHISTVGLVPAMNNRTSSAGKGPALNPKLLPIVQHNCLGSWDVLLSLFESLNEVGTYHSLALLQEPPVSKAHLPSFNGFKSFFPTVRKLHVAAYVHIGLLSSYSVLPRFCGVDDVLARDVSSQEPLFRPSFHVFRLINAYSTNTRNH